MTRSKQPVKEHYPVLFLITVTGDGVKDLIKAPSHAIEYECDEGEIQFIVVAEDFFFDWEVFADNIRKLHPSFVIERIDYVPSSSVMVKALC